MYGAGSIVAGILIFGFLASCWITIYLKSE